MFLCRFLHLCVQVDSLVIPGFTWIVRWISFPPPSRRHDCLHLCLVHSAVSVSLMCINSPVPFFSVMVFVNLSLIFPASLFEFRFPVVFLPFWVYLYFLLQYLTYILPVSCVAESLCHYHIWMYFDITLLAVIQWSPHKKLNLNIKVSKLKILIMHLGAF